VRCFAPPKSKNGGTVFVFWMNRQNEKPIFFNLIQNQNALFPKSEKNKFREKGRSLFLNFFESSNPPYFHLARLTDI